jgi:chitin disaccharide deacetylase
VTTGLIVNADDFGLTSGVNRAIVELHAAGVLTSATLMARAAATDEAIEIAKATPSLGVGCHVVLVDGEPVLSGIHDIPNVADPVYARFEPTLFRFLNTIYTRGAQNKVDYQIETEARAQIQSLQSRGLRLTHIDTHKHTHMFPRVLRPVLGAARSCGIRAVRNPFEPAWSVRSTPSAPLTRRLQVRLLRVLESRFRRIVAEEGFVTTEGAIGVLATGTLDAKSVAGLVRSIPQDGKIYELVTHPGYNDADLARVSTRLRQSRETERQALLGLRSAPNLELISFAGLQQPKTAD